MPCRKGPTSLRARCGAALCEGERRAADRFVQAAAIWFLNANWMSSAFDFAPITSMIRYL